jgi:MinD superfamily P-loop ATPase
VILAVASGKGGTGKTSVVAALAAVWPAGAVLADVDVEAPNLHLFVHPVPESSEEVGVETPVVRAERCTACGACADLCQFGAIALLGGRAQVFSEMCHSCGGCFRVCPADALARGSRMVGEIIIGRTARHTVVTGRLRLGEAMAPPLMREVLARAIALAAGRDLLVDAPPGVSCPAMTAVEQADAILLVTEPTPFGLHDFQLAHQAFAPLGKPMAVVINRDGLGDAPVGAYCRTHHLPVLARIPYSSELAGIYARGGSLAEDPVVRAAMEAAAGALRA